MANPLVVVDDLGGGGGMKNVNRTRASHARQAKAKIHDRA
jgi:hypothetical protein